MDPGVFLSDLLGGLRRRWYAALAGLFLTIGLCFGAFVLVPVQYVASSSVLLLPPGSTVGAGGNPYVALGGLQGAADVVGRAMSDDVIAEEVIPKGSGDTYTFEPDATTNAPMLVVATQADTAQGALTILDSLLARAPMVWQSLQVKVGAPSNSLIRLSVVTHDTEATKNRKSQLRAVIVAGAVGLALLLFLTNLLDGFLLRRAGGATESSRKKVQRVAARAHEGLPDASVAPAGAAENGGGPAPGRRSNPLRSPRLRPPVDVLRQELVGPE